MRKKHPEHVNLERWLVSYADFITLLFAFFVIMYAISQADLAKFRAVSDSLKAAFAAPGPSGMIDLGGSGGGSTANPLDTVGQPVGRAFDMPAGKTHTASDPDGELQSIKELLEESISLELGVSDTSDKMQLTYDSRGLVVRLAVKDFFKQGSVEIEPDLIPLLDRIGRIVSKTTRLIRIEGHTDPSEKNTPGYPSEWELSAARAASLAKLFLSRFEFEPKRMSIAGYSHYRPLVVGTSPEARGANRRVEIIILNTEFDER
mgnify:CR=1 FL=1